MKTLLLIFILCFTAFGQITEKIYRDEKYSFSVRYPSDWVIVPAVGVHSRFKIASDEGLGLATFSIVIISPPELKNMTSAEFANGLAKSPHIINATIETGLPGAKLISKGKTFLSNREAFFVKYAGTYRSLDNSQDITVYQIITVFQGKSITLSCGGQTALFERLYQETCKEIASSFVLMPTKIILPPKNKSTIKRRNN